MSENADFIPPVEQRLSFVDRLERLIPELRAYARGLCKDPTLADDLVQDTCLKAWSAIDTFDPDRPMRPWLFRILRNEYFQITRRSWRNVSTEPEQLEQAIANESDWLLQSEAARVTDVINRLPINQRDALILVLAAGFTYEEAGKICNCSPGTIKSRVSRAREAVKTEAQNGLGRKLAVIVESSGLSALDNILSHIDRLTTDSDAA